MYKPHPSCTTPQNNQTKVWRYMDIEKLLSMLESDSLWFPNIKQCENKDHSGLPIDIDLNTLIEKIFVAPNSPHWIHKLLEKVIKRYGLNVPVEQSRLYADPL